MEITLTLCGFRCYEQETTYIFTPKEIIRIKGRSGIGKTTILEAIQWVLYNYPTTNIYSRMGKGKVCYVQLTLPHKGKMLTIRRQKNPSLLLLTFPDNREEEDDIAQATINSLFGSKDIWRACCYLPQESSCPLLSFSNTQRLEILEALAFLNERPEEDIQKIKEEIKRLEIQFQAQEKIHLYHTQIVGSSVGEDKLLSPEKEASLLEELQESSQKILTLQDIMAIERQVQSQLQGLETRITRVTTSLESIPLAPEEEEERLKGEIKDLQLLLPTVQEEERKRVQFQTLEKQLKQVQANLGKVPPPSDEEQERIEEEIKVCQEMLPLSQALDQRRKLEKAKGELESKLLALPSAPKIAADAAEEDLTMEDYYATLSDEKLIKEEKTLVAKYKLSYDSPTIQERLTRITSLLDSQKDALIWQRIKELRRKLESLSGKEVTPEELEKTREELRGLERSLDAIKCPSCRRSLRYLKGKLILSETSPVSQEKVTALRNSLLMMERDFKKSHERSLLVTQLDSLSSTVPPEEPILLTSSQKKSLEEEKRSLLRLTFPPEIEVSSQEIKTLLTRRDLERSLQEVTTELRGFPEEDPSGKSSTYLLQEIKTLTQRLKSLQAITSRYESLREQEKTLQERIQDIPLNPITKESKFIQKEIDTLRKQVTTLEYNGRKRKELQEQLTSYQEELLLVQGRSNGLSLEEIAREIEVLLSREKEIRGLLEAHKKELEYLERKKQLDVEEKKLLTLQKQLGAALRLRDIAIHEECEILEEKIELVNSAITEVCDRIFIDPISVKLSMLKTGKTTKTTKPHVHLSIQYKGGEYDSLSQLSGGEGKRISIAVSLALSQLSKFPLLLLDECLAGLDEELKEATLEAIREITQGEDKTILCIMHDGVEGYYDRSISVTGE